MNGTARFKLNYIEVPLLLVLNLTDNFNVYAGPYAAYLISGRVRNESNGTLFDFEDNIHADDYNRPDAGIAAGTGLDFKSVSLGARFTYGLTTVGKEQTYMGTTYVFPDAGNEVLVFICRFRFTRIKPNHTITESKSTCFERLFDSL